MLSLNHFWSILTLALTLTSAAITVHRWRSHILPDARSFDDCMTDIRTMNTYNSYMLTGIIVFLGLSMQQGVIPIPAMTLLLVTLAFIFASCAIFFIPLAKPEQQVENETAGIFPAKRLWLYTIILTQWTVTLTVMGIVYLVTLRILSASPDM